MGLPVDNTLGMGLFTALTGAVAYLFKLFVDQAKGAADLRERVGKAEGRQEGITRLHAETLDTVFRAARMTPEELPGLLPEETED